MLNEAIASNLEVDWELPLIAQWAEEQQDLILSEGISLSSVQMWMAKVAGVRNPEQVRLVYVQGFEFPSDPSIEEIAQQLGVITSGSLAMSFFRGIMLHEDAWGDNRLLLHELVHVAQYERMGGVLPFLEAYARQYADFGPDEAPLERAARQAVERIVGFIGWQSRGC